MCDKRLSIRRWLILATIAVALLAIGFACLRPPMIVRRGKSTWMYAGWHWITWVRHEDRSSSKWEWRPRGALRSEKRIVKVTKEWRVALPTRVDVARLVSACVAIAGLAGFIVAGLVAWRMGQEKTNTGEEA